MDLSGLRGVHGLPTRVGWGLRALISSYFMPFLVRLLAGTAAFFSPKADKLTCHGRNLLGLGRKAEKSEDRGCCKLASKSYARSLLVSQADAHGTLFIPCERHAKAINLSPRGLPAPRRLRAEPALQWRSAPQASEVQSRGQARPRIHGASHGQEGCPAQHHHHLRLAAQRAQEKTCILQMIST